MKAGVAPERSRRVVGPRRALVAAAIGNAVEWYDFALFGATAAVIASVLAPGDWAGFVIVFAVFATSCLFRPLGSLIIGVRADRRGRQRVFAATILAMSFATFAMGLLPPWSVIGWAAPMLLLVLRGVQAFSAGGEIGVSISYLTETSQPHRRGWVGGWYLSTVAIGLAFGLAMAALVAASLDAVQLRGWGWRVPFLIALPLGLVGAYLRLRLGEPPSFAPSPLPVRPRAVLRAHGSTIRRCFLIGAAYSAAFNVWFVFLPSHLAVSGATSLAGALAGALVGLLAVAGAAPLLGRLSDHVGRRPLLIGASTALAVTAVPMYLWTGNGSGIAIVAGNIVIGIILAAFVLPTFLAEQFPANSRATGIGLAYGVSSALIGGTAPLVAIVLTGSAPVFAVPAYLTVWAALALAAVAGLRSPAPTAAIPSSDGSLS